MKILISFLIAMSVYTVSMQSLSSQNSGLPKVNNKLAQGNSEFAINLYQELGKKEDGNIFFSPYNVSTALTLVYAGARGQTAEQMRHVLHFPFEGTQLHSAFGELIKTANAKDSSYLLSVANALWGQQGFKFLPEYLTLLNDRYSAGFEQLDFSTHSEEARQTINSWIEKKTNDKIKELFKPGTIDGSARLVLTNAVYFKGSWVSEFDPKQTKQEPFKLSTPSRRQEITASMMHQTENFKYGEQSDLQVIELPYADENNASHLSMIIMLPRMIDGLASLEKTLNAEKINQILSAMRSRKVDLAIPKFQATSQFDLGDVLNNLGMSLVFSDKADLSAMTGDHELRLSLV
ncbi:MAG: serpin family protein, partial [Pyrinomonadaceae bacterium]